jgi:hypothetical protein
MKTPLYLPLLVLISMNSSYSAEKDENKIKCEDAISNEINSIDETKLIIKPLMNNDSKFRANWDFYRSSLMDVKSEIEKVVSSNLSHDEKIEKINSFFESKWREGKKAYSTVFRCGSKEKVSFPYTAGAGRDKNPIIEGSQNPFQFFSAQDIFTCPRGEKPPRETPFLVMESDPSAEEIHGILPAIENGQIKLCSFSTAPRVSLIALECVEMYKEASSQKKSLESGLAHPLVSGLDGNLAYHDNVDKIIEKLDEHASLWSLKCGTYYSKNKDKFKFKSSAQLKESDVNQSGRDELKNEDVKTKKVHQDGLRSTHQ